MKRRCSWRGWIPVLAIAGCLVMAWGHPALAQEPARTSCTLCHGNPDTFDHEAIDTIVKAFGEGAHAQVGLSCHDCHGGNPDPQLAEDMDAAMDAGFRANPYRGVPARTEVPQFCGRCHSDAAYMKRFKPDLRVDQEAEYWTSHHGEQLRKGNTKVATCVDCHGVHGIRSPQDPQSHVYPTKVAETCNACHGDPQHMQGAKLPDGRPLPVDQYGRWRRSVHAKAMFDKGDLSAPTCNDCHGNHGATPPEIESVAFVCGQCHGREAELFRASPKHAGFTRHTEYLEDAGGEGCIACHESPHPAAALPSSVHFSECVTCHGNHSVVRPSIAMLAPLPPTPCALCHEDQGADVIPEPEKTVQHYSQLLGELLAQAEEQQLQGEALFDWLVDRAQELPTHTLTVTSEEGEPLTTLRPEFSRLFEKFRIGKTHFTYEDPASGQERTDRVRRCTDCHEASDDSASGAGVARRYLDRMHALTVRTARAERMLLRARRGGVEVGEALTALDQAVDAQIQLEALVHAFESDGEFSKTHLEGVEAANTALEHGREALHELQTRRQGLAVALGVILIVLIALGLKMRSVSRPEDAEALPGSPSTS